MLKLEIAGVFGELMIGFIASFTAGVLLIQQLPDLPAPQWLVAGVIPLTLCTRLRYWKCLGFVLGFIWAAGFSHIILHERLPAELEGKILQVSGSIVGLPIPNEHRVRFDLAVNPRIDGVPSRLRLNWYYPVQEIKAGQYWRMAVKLKRPHGSLNPGGFDYERWLFSEGIGASGYVRNWPAPVLQEKKPSILNISVWRQAVSEALDQIMPEQTNRALIKALTIGERHQLSSGQWTVFRQTGTVHLMAISGLHIGLIAGLVYFLVSVFWKRIGFLACPVYKIAAIGAWLAALLYAAMAGFSVPTQRALIMLTVMMLALIWQRNVRPVNVLALAFLTILLSDPLAVLSAGFWLSFLAVAVIAYSSAGQIGSERRWLKVMRVHGITALALSPLLLLYFQQVSLVAPIANLIAVPVVSLLVVPLALVAVLLLWAAPGVAQHILVLADIILQGLYGLLTELSALPFAYLNQGEPSWFALLLAGAGIAMLLAPKGIPGRWLGGVMLMPLIFMQAETPKSGELKLTLLDVGQGLSVVAQTEHHALVFDTGARFASGTDMGTAVVLPFLRRQGINTLDALLVSHGDNDHIGGARSLLEGVSVNRLYSSVPEQLKPSVAEPCQSGQSWWWDEVHFIILSPGQKPFESENDNSCVLKINSRFGSVLLTGDIEKPAEAWLVHTYGGEHLQSDVLVAPHHGSKTSSTHSFLQAVRPETVLIPAGYLNRFGFPHATVLQHYAAVNSDWLNTADQGAIEVYFSASGVAIESYRLTRGGYWNMKP